MKLLINETDFKENVKVAAALKFKPFETSIRKIQRKMLLPIFGQGLFDELVTAYEGTPSDVQKEVLQMIHPILANLALWLSAAGNNILWTDSGAQAKHSGDMKPAFQWQVKDAKKQYMDTGFDAIDELILFLEENKATYPTWITHTETRSRLINTALEFSQYVTIKRRLFEDLKPIISRVERDTITELLGATLYIQIKAQLLTDAGLNAANQNLLTDLQVVTAHLSYAQAVKELPVIIDETGVNLYNNAFSGNYEGTEPADSGRVHAIVSQHEQFAHIASTRLIKFLNANASTYADFTKSDHYIDPEEDEFDESESSIIDL